MALQPEVPNLMTELMGLSPQAAVTPQNPETKILKH
jgi:hypothetical protein